MAERVQGDLISTPPDRYAGGPLTGWSDPTWDELLDGTVYSTAKICAPTSFLGDGGIFLKDSHVKSNIGSDYKFFEIGRVINRAAQVAARAMRRYYKSNVKVKQDGSGQIIDGDRIVIEQYVQGQLDASLVDVQNAEGTNGHVSGVQFSI